MEIKEFIDKALKLLEDLPKDDLNKMDFLVYYESQITLEKFREFFEKKRTILEEKIAQYKEKINLTNIDVVGDKEPTNSKKGEKEYLLKDADNNNPLKEKVTSEFLEELEAYLIHRRNNTFRTIASYNCLSIKPQSSANLFCRKLANLCVNTANTISYSPQNDEKALLIPPQNSQLIDIRTAYKNFMESIISDLANHPAINNKLTKSIKIEMPFIASKLLEIFTRFEEHPKSEEEESEKKEEIELLVEKEQKYSLNKLQKMLLNVKPGAITFDSLVPFITFLEERWAAIKDTSASYKAKPASQINIICKNLACYISLLTYRLNTHLNIDMGMEITNILTPEITIDPSKSATERLEHYVYQKILNQDYSYLIYSRADRIRQSMKNWLEILSKSSDENLAKLTNENHAERDLLLNLESNMSFKKLVTVLQSLIESKEQDSSLLIQPLLTFFNDRWDEIRKTDAIYPHTPHSRINIACTMIAIQISIHLPEIHPYELLMYTLKNSQYFSYHNPDSARENRSNLQLHQFIIGDDEVPIAILETLKLSENQKIPDPHESKIFYKDEAQTGRLTCQEKIRLLNHSSAVQDYYREMVNTSSPVSPKKLTKKLNRIADEINSYPYTVTSTYDKDGEERLRTAIFKNVKTPKDLEDLVVEFLPNRTDWGIFLKGMPTENLCKILLNLNSDGRSKNDDLDGKTTNVHRAIFEKDLLKKAEIPLNNLVQSPLDLGEDEKHIRAKLYSMLEIYMRTTINAPAEFNSFLGYVGNYASKWTGSFAKTEKKGSSKLFGEFLLSDHPLHDFEGYVKQQGKYASHWSPLTIHPGGKISTLVKLVEIAMDAGRKLLEASEGYQNTRLKIV